MNNKFKFNCSIDKLLALAVFSLVLLGLNQNAHANEIVDLEGDIKVRRQGETKFESADFLDLLDYEDTIQVGANSEVKIRCANSNFVLIKKYSRVSDYCDPGEGTEPIDNNRDLFG